ncbi:hypothetical protein DVA67_008955 [Solirubrobacter sp. CPCC 204708]|uniref:Uncharacterized protein n=1 Tax=Solirubrobacter deserti TaxID=2282478 RepID=A0ABT4RE93_9ACTN|nr:hypothetical protein [Solirubrobacter deserti]MBE2316103.1 hypothetical protein [Solirubrobacter deserti]MDA0136853.1 hypothetical protein [Solirubrobacter deserti]
MESYREALAVAERAGAAPYIDYPATPKWYPAAAGAWFAALILACHGASERPAVFIPLLVALIGAEFAFIAWYRRRWQTWPSLRHAPKEIASAYRRYFLVVVPAFAAGIALYAFVGPFVAAAFAFVVVTAGLAAYERLYRDAADATRRRLA